jgi:hypothetical protein
VATGDVAATVAGTASSATLDLSGIEDAYVILTGTGVTGGATNIYLQDSADGGTTYYDLAGFNQVAAATASIQAMPFALSAYAVAIGSGASPAIAAGTFRGTRWAPRFRLVSVAGVGTSAGQTFTAKIYGR